MGIRRQRQGGEELEELSTGTDVGNGSGSGQQDRQQALRFLARLIAKRLIDEGVAAGPETGKTMAEIELHSA